MKWLVVVFLALLAASAMAQPASSLDQCIASRVGGPAAQVTPEMLERVSGICFDIIGDGHRLRKLEATTDIYKDQIFQGRVLLFMVVFITLSGIVLAALQLWASYRLAVAGQGTLAEGGDVSIATGKVAVKSSVVGVVILALSLAFFAIYVLEVYTIEPLSADGGADAGRPATLKAPPPPAGMTQVPR